MTTAGVAAGRRPTPPALRVLEHRLVLYRRSWRGSAFNSFVSPALFLGSIGLGLGTYVNATASLGVPYVVFLAPGLLAGAAMQTAATEATFPVMAGLVWVRSFQAMTATPIRPHDIVLGLIASMAIRITIVASIFTAVIVALGAAASPAVVLGVPAAVLTGLAFAAPIMAFSASQKDTVNFNALFRFGITPLFLFSGTFFPIDQLPVFVQPVAWLTPLFHGVALSRGLALGTAAAEPLAMVAHAGYLVALTVAGLAWARAAFRRRLER